MIQKVLNPGNKAGLVKEKKLIQKLKEGLPGLWK
jgi:hypothetical protein